MRVGREYYEVLEGMHYVCFHYEFEHGMGGENADPDEDCGVAGCPSAPAVRHKDRLVAVVRALVADWSDGPPANWDNHSLPDYLGSLSAWLEDSERYYADRGVSVPWNGWEVVQHAMRAATVHDGEPDRL
ncbi:hypothetical protein ADK67_40875 [Saccharothrix sp. NRRL B-16348]|nr:hypothetical protein ADK67_40875 [Saccharothrix sp. NRRL B-16348]